MGRSSKLSKLGGKELAFKKSKATKLIAVSSAVFASSIVAANPQGAEASSNVESLVKNAENLANALKWEVSYEHRKVAYPKNVIDYPNMKLFNEAKAAMFQAENALKNATGAQNEALKARLDQNVKLHYDRAVKFIDAVTAGKRIQAKAKALQEKLSKNLIDDSTEKAYHELSQEIKERSPIIYRAYGKSTRDAFLDLYQVPAYKTKDAALYPVSIKIEIDRLNKALAENDLEKAKYHANRLETFFEEGVKGGHLVEKSELYNKLSEFYKKSHDNYTEKVQGTALGAGAGSGSGGGGGGSVVTPTGPKQLSGLYLNNDLIIGETTATTADVVGVTLKQGQTFDVIADSDHVQIAVGNVIQLTAVKAGTTTLTIKVKEGNKVVAEGVLKVTITQPDEEDPVLTPTYEVTFDGIEGATVVVKDSEGEVVVADSDGSYNLADGTYSYTVTKEGFKTVEGTIEVNGKDLKENVMLIEVQPDVTDEEIEAAKSALAEKVQKAVEGTEIDEATFAFENNVITITIQDEESTLLSLSRTGALVSLAEMNEVTGYKINGVERSFFDNGERKSDSDIKEMLIEDALEALKLNDEISLGALVNKEFTVEVIGKDGNVDFTDTYTFNFVQKPVNEEDKEAARSELSLKVESAVKTMNIKEATFTFENNVITITFHDINIAPSLLSGTGALVALAEMEEVKGYTIGETVRSFFDEEGNRLDNTVIKEKLIEDALTALELGDDANLGDLAGRFFNVVVIGEAGRVDFTDTYTFKFETDQDLEEAQQ